MNISFCITVCNEHQELQELLAQLPVEEIGSIAVENAHKEMADSEFSEQWFETGEVVEIDLSVTELDEDEIELTRRRAD